MSQNIFCKYCHRIPNQCNCTHPVKEEHFEDEPQAEELHEIMQSNTHPVKEQDEPNWKEMYWQMHELNHKHWAELKAHPVEELNDGGEPVKNATYWKRQYNLMATQNDNLKSGLYHANEQIKYLETHPAKEQDTDCQYCKQGCIRCDARKQLTDEEIQELSEKHLDMDWQTGVIDFARAILLKAQEK